MNERPVFERRTPNASVFLSAPLNDLRPLHRHQEARP